MLCINDKNTLRAILKFNLNQGENKCINPTVIILNL